MTNLNTLHEIEENDDKNMIKLSKRRHITPHITPKN